MADLIQPVGIASGEALGIAHTRLPVARTGACAQGVRVVDHAADLGLWRLRNTRVLWRFNCQEIALNASAVTVTDGSKWNSPMTLSGDVIVGQLREYDEKLWDGTTRAATIRDMPKKIELEFPAMPASFYHLIRRMRTFSERVRVEITLFDALDPEPLLTNDYRTYYASSGQWKDGSLRLYVNGAPVIEGFTYDAAYGYVTFPAPLSPDDAVLATYVWAPLCFLTGEVTPVFKARAIPLSDREIGVRLTLVESRGPARGLYLPPLAALLLAGMASEGGIGMANLVIASLADPCDPEITGAGLASDCHTALNLLYWYKADAGISAAEGATFSPWAGQGGTPDATQPTVAARPIYRHRYTHNVPVVTDKGYPDTDWGNAFDLSGSRARGSLTAYFVVRYDVFNALTTPLTETSGALMEAVSAGGGFSMLARYNPGQSSYPTVAYVKLNVSATSGHPGFSVEAPAVCGWQVLTFVIDAANSLLLIYRNGTEIASGAYTPAPTETDSAWGLLGANSTTTPGPVNDYTDFEGDAVEVQAYYPAAHDAATVAAKAACLIARHGLPALVACALGAPTTDGPYTATEGQNVTLNGAAGLPGGQSLYRAVWNFGDGTTATGLTVTHAWPVIGIPIDWTVTLLIESDCGAVSAVATVAHISP